MLDICILIPRQWSIPRNKINLLPIHHVWVLYCKVSLCSIWANLKQFSSNTIYSTRCNHLQSINQEWNFTVAVCPFMTRLLILIQHDTLSHILLFHKFTVAASRFLEFQFAPINSDLVTSVRLLENIQSEWKKLCGQIRLNNPKFIPPFFVLDSR